MARKKSKEQIHKNMSRVRNSDTALEKLLCEELVRQGLTMHIANIPSNFETNDSPYLLYSLSNNSASPLV